LASLRLDLKGGQKPFLSVIDFNLIGCLKSNIFQAGILYLLCVKRNMFLSIFRNANKKPAKIGMAPIGLAAIGCPIPETDSNASSVWSKSQTEPVSGSTPTFFPNK